MRKFVFGILIVLAIVFLLYWFFFRRDDSDSTVAPNPSPIVDVDVETPPASDNQVGAGSVLSYSANLRREDQQVTGKVRFLTAPQNQTLVSVVLSAPLPGQEPAQVRLHSGTCQAIGKQISQFGVLSEYAVESLVRESISTLFPNGEERVVILVRPEADTQYELCGTISESESLSTLTYPSLRRLAPIQTHQPANTGWAW